MKHIFAIFLILSVLLCAPNYIPAQTQSANEVNFYLESPVTTNWYNLTISDHYSIKSSDEFYNNLQIPFLSNPWAEINTILKNNNFFNMTIADVNSSIVLHIIYDGNENTVHVSERGSNYELENIITYFYKILNRVTGDFREQFPMWASQISVEVMESYPELYSVDTIVVRGKDLLTVVNDYNVTLFVTDYNFLATYILPPNGSLLYAETQKLSLPSGGNSKEISFATFSVGKDYSPNDLFFTVILNGEYTFMLEPNGDFIIQQHIVDISQKPTTSYPTKDSTTSTINSLDILQWQMILSIAVIMVPIRLLYKNSKTL